MVVAGEPVMIRFSLSLRPDLVRARGFCLGGSYEGQSFGRLGDVVDRDRNLLTRRVRVVQRDQEFFTSLVSKRQRLSSGQANAMDSHLARVDLQLFEVIDGW